jgi:predicted nucleic acid-binding protein
MIVVADSSALVALSVCDSLLLLDALFGEGKVPQAVYDEVCIANEFLIKADFIGQTFPHLAAQI